MKLNLENQLEKKTKEVSVLQLDLDQAKSDMSAMALAHAEEKQKMDGSHVERLQNLERLCVESEEKLNRVSDELEVVKSKNNSLKKAVAAQTQLRMNLEEEVRQQQILIEVILNYESEIDSKNVFESQPRAH